MHTTQIYTTTLPNGLTVIGEELPSAQSATCSVLIGTGASDDPEELLGLANITCDMLLKGAGIWNLEELNNRFEDLGIHRSHAAGLETTMLSTSMLPEQTPQAVELLATVIQQPRFPVEELENVKQLVLQDILSIEDNPGSKVMVELHSKFYPAPFNRPVSGEVDTVNRISIEDVRDYHSGKYTPENAIIAIAGKFHWTDFLAQVQKYFGNWQGNKSRLSGGFLPEKNCYHHVTKNTNQMHLALAYKSVALGHPDCYTASLVVGILSGGMAGRLFVEVREKRGLVYTVSASLSATQGRGAIICHAGTTPEKADETLTVMLQTLREVNSGLTIEELDRAKADLKSRVIMRGELPSNRASGLVSDWWNIKRIRTLDEIKNAIEAVTIDDIVRYAENFPAEPVTLVSLGSQQLNPAW